jgi:CheY-like chemotaxis protein
MKHGPIILVEDDPDDMELFIRAIKDLKVSSPVIPISGGEAALEFLSKTTEQPFVILCDINMPGMNGINLRKIINDNDYLRVKSIPFIFFSTSADKNSVDLAFDMTVQGFFKKPDNYEKITETLNMIFSYWDLCQHPNGIL